MEELSFKREGREYSKELYHELESFIAQDCVLVLQDGKKVKGHLNSLSLSADGIPQIGFKVKDGKIFSQYNYNLEFDNIKDVERVE